MQVQQLDIEKFLDSLTPEQQMILAGFFQDANTWAGSWKAEAMGKKCEERFHARSEEEQLTVREHARQQFLRY